MLNLSTSIGDPEDGVSNVTLMQQRAKSDDFNFSEFDDDFSDEVLANIDESFLCEDMSDNTSGGHANCVLSPVFNNCNITINFGK